MLYVNTVLILSAILFSGSARAEKFELVGGMQDQVLFAEDGAHQILLPLGKFEVQVSEFLAKCQWEKSQISENQEILLLQMETDRDDGFNGCIIEILESGSQRKSTIQVGYSIDEPL